MKIKSGNFTILNSEITRDFLFHREISIIRGKGCKKHVYYLSVAILMLFFEIFEDDKTGNFLRGDKSFRTLKRTKSRQKQNK